MNSRNFLVGGIVAGIAYFLLGWVIYGILMKDFMHDHSNPSFQALMRPENEMVWWSMILGNFGFGFLLSYVMAKSGTVTAAGGLVTGFVVGLLSALAIDFIFYAQMNMGDMTSVWADIAASAIMSALVGGITGFVLSLMNKRVTA